MKRKLNVFAALTMLLMFSMSYYQQCSMVVMLVWTIVGFFGIKLTADKSDKFLLATEVCMLMLFVVNALSVFFSFDKVEGLNNLGSFLPFAIVPLMALLYSDVLKDNYIRLLKFFVIGTLSASVICLLAAFVRSFHIVDGTLVFNPYVGFRNQFVYTHLSIFLYTNTFAMCVVFATAVLVWSLLFRNPSHRWLVYSGLALCILMIFLLSSRTNVYALFAVLYLSVLVFYLRFKKLFHSVALLIAVTGLFWVFQTYNYRVMNLSKTVTSYITEEDILLENGYLVRHPESIDGVNIRFKMWETGAKLMRRYWLTGCGLGDYKEVLRSEYQYDGIDEAYQKGYDQHNQYIETFATSGLVGGVVLLSILFIALLSALRNRNYLLFCCLISIGLNMLLESMLNRFSASLFFVVAMLVSMQARHPDCMLNSHKSS